MDIDAAVTVLKFGNSFLKLLEFSTQFCTIQFYLFIFHIFQNSILKNINICEILLFSKTFFIKKNDILFMFRFN